MLQSHFTSRPRILHSLLVWRTNNKELSDEVKTQGSGAERSGEERGLKRQWVTPVSWEWMKTTTVWTVTDLETAPRPGRRCSGGTVPRGITETEDLNQTRTDRRAGPCMNISALVHTHTHTHHEGWDRRWRPRCTVGVTEATSQEVAGGSCVLEETHTEFQSRTHTHTHTADAKKNNISYSSSPCYR